MSERMKIVQAILADFTERGSVDSLLANVADDVVLKNAIPSTAPFGGEFRGKKGILHYFERVDTVLDLGAVRVTDYFEGRDRIVVLGDERLRIKSSGVEFDSVWCTVFTFRENRIVRVDVIEDHSLFFASLGASA